MGFPAFLERHPIYARLFLNDTNAGIPCQKKLRSEKSPRHQQTSHVPQNRQPTITTVLNYSSGDKNNITSVVINWTKWEKKKANETNKIIKNTQKYSTFFHMQKQKNERSKERKNKRFYKRNKR